MTSPHSGCLHTSRGCPGIFGDVAWGNKDRLPEHALINLIDTFDKTVLNRDRVPGDVLGAAYEYLLRSFADESGKKAGEFFTPRAVVHLLVDILAPQPGESVYDPACGSGGMLVETINAVRTTGGDTRTLRLYGQEVNLTTAAIARMNLFLHDLEDFRIARGDTFRDPKFLAGDDLELFDVVIANPPFSLQNWGADTWASDPWKRAFCGVPPAKNGDFAWIQHMVASMRPENGRVGVVMPHGVLFRGGAEAKIRQCILETDRLEAVIGLPSNLFYSTSIPACLLIFRATKPAERQGKVLFVDGSARFSKGRNQNVMSDGDMEAITSAYRTGEDPDGPGGVQVHLVELAEIKDNGWDLNVGRYDTDPDGFTRWMKGQNDITGGNLKRVIRLMKHLRDHRNDFRLMRSVLLTIVLGERVDVSKKIVDPGYYQDLPTSFYHLICDLDGWLSSQSSIPTIVDPSGAPDQYGAPVTFNHRWDERIYEAFCAKVAHIAELTRNAYEDDTSVEHSLKLWQKVFGPEFKLPAAAPGGSSSTAPGAASILSGRGG